MTISLKFTFMAMDVQLLQHHLFKEFIFPPLIFLGNFFQKSVWHIYVRLLLGSLFYSTDLHVYSSTNITLSC